MYLYPGVDSLCYGVDYGQHHGGGGRVGDPHGQEHRGEHEPEHQPGLARPNLRVVGEIATRGRGRGGLLSSNPKTSEHQSGGIYT